MYISSEVLLHDVVKARGQTVNSFMVYFPLGLNKFQIIHPGYVVNFVDLNTINPPKLTHQANMLDVFCGCMCLLKYYIISGRDIMDTKSFFIGIMLLVIVT